VLVNSPAKKKKPQPMKIMMEGNVSKKKKDKFIGMVNKGSVSYFMVLTD
tara:strand:+ start:1790 stop:1936 length:147 start_codon:yes stop_codon:yes gene_type:complete